MARTWLAIEVELLHGVHAECDPAPGRIFIVGPAHTFGQLARAIDFGFARWDHSHLFEFELADGSTISFPEFDIGDENTLEQATTKVLRLVKPGNRFSYRFDFGDDWMHECVVHADKVDPVVAYGTVPQEPVPIFGWGTIPDQYGRVTGREGDGDPIPELPFPFLHEELERIIELNARAPMTSAQLADTINAEDRYHKQDGSPVTPSQVSARVSKYPRLFKRADDGAIELPPRPRW